MTEVKLCHKDGAELFHTVETAKYVETIETIIFLSKSFEEQRCYHRPPLLLMKG